jgi:hypothetical protein
MSVAFWLPDLVQHFLDGRALALIYSASRQSSSRLGVPRTKHFRSGKMHKEMQIRKVSRARCETFSACLLKPLIPPIVGRGLRGVKLRFLFLFPTRPAAGLTLFGTPSKVIPIEAHKNEKQSLTTQSKR